MNLQTKALYHLLRLNHSLDPSIPCEEWQIEDLRAVSLEDLFHRLNKMDIRVDPARLGSFAEECDSPEELAELLIPDGEDSQLYDRAYLIIFEIWRRLYPQKQSLSIFCDELDHRISLYYAGELESDESLQNALSNLEEILNENVDSRISPTKVFASIGSYCAHDLMSFIVDYISNVLDCKNQIYASELIEDFSPYAPRLIWFDFLRARLMALTDPIEANRMIEAILKQDARLTLDLLLEILRFQLGYGERLIFAQTVKKALARLQTEEEFQQLLELSADYYRRRDREDLEQAVRRILIEHQKLGGPILSNHPDIQRFVELIPSD